MVDSITLEDVELCIKILRRFMIEYKNAERVLSSITSTSRFSRPEDRFVQMILANKYKLNQEQNIEQFEDIELSSEEKEKLKKIKEELLNKND